MKRISARIVEVSSADVRRFNMQWPCSELVASRGYRFEFDGFGDLVDCDIPESEDGSAGAAMSQDCGIWLARDVVPSWAELEPDAVPETPQPAGKRLVELLAAAFQALLNTEKTGNNEWAEIWKNRIEELCSDHMPSGSGFDSGTTLDLDHSRPDKLVFNTAFHHMNDHGSYSGWTDHRVIVSPSFVFGLELKVTGRDKNGIKDYIGQAFELALNSVEREPGSTD